MKVGLLDHMSPSVSLCSLGFDLILGSSCSGAGDGGWEKQQRGSDSRAWRCSTTEEEEKEEDAYER